MVDTQKVRSAWDADIIAKPAQFASLSGEIGVLGDTIIECEHRRHCEALYDHLKRRNNDA